MSYNKNTLDQAIACGLMGTLAEEGEVADLFSCVCGFV